MVQCVSCVVQLLYFISCLFMGVGVMFSVFILHRFSNVALLPTLRGHLAFAWSKPSKSIWRKSPVHRPTKNTHMNKCGCQTWFIYPSTGLFAFLFLTCWMSILPRQQVSWMLQAVAPGCLRHTVMCWPHICWHTQKCVGNTCMCCQQICVGNANVCWQHT